MSFYSKAKRIISGPVRFIFNVKVVGAENEPEDGAYLICPNHISYADPVIVGACLRHNPLYMAKKELMRIPVLKQILKLVGAYGIDRGGNDVSAIKKTISMLKDGESVILFPQGTRCRGVDPRDTKYKYGCAMIAKRAEVPVIPILIETKHFKMRLFRRITIHIGKPISRDELAAAYENAEDYALGAKLIFSRITDMIEKVES